MRVAESRSNPFAEHERTRAALRAALPRLTRLLRDVPDLGAPSGVPVWTVGDVGAHVGTVYLAYCSAFTHELEEWDGVLPPGDGPFIERITRVNAESIGLFDADGRRNLAVRGGPRLAVVIGDGTATVTRDAPPRSYDCRISAAPAAFLLVAFRRTPLWKVIARGGIRAGGRKPWLAPRLSRLVAGP
ncbi:hypothetical protein [Streptomyces albireticuli]|uniref:Mycothiol-dependent maleylpyruvate isomerase metal-binding domain-containing protein n=1 Tax=Streptomyces albireticuli TaxID=1940 RepID=A0A2A2CXR7_9ACTN|nr:hypothetical protein [Streptomyces albireticuli]MCD9196186.1 hypothetical protein [Streptomyces albireticuli]PAU44993.1 hypothetical protein CK936_31945 [Streptomyces albireticuli]